jgi:hypothetical protein
MKRNLIFLILFATLVSSPAFPSTAATDLNATESLLLKWEMCSQKVKQAATAALSDAVSNQMKNAPEQRVSGSVHDITDIQVVDTDPVSFRVTVPYTLKFESADGFGGGVNREFVIQADPFGKPGLLVPGMLPGAASYGCRVTVQR